MQGLWPPDLVLNFTCNAQWREIEDVLHFEPGQQPCDGSDLVMRVFHMKVDEFLVDIKEGKTFGPILAVLYTVEFKKRGLPHMHCLVWLADGSKEFTSYKSSDPALPSTGAALETVKVPNGPAASPKMRKDDDAANVQEIDAGNEDITDVPAGSSTTKTQKILLGQASLAT
ncbi:hypothetical protein U9M48_002821 [Paspalum notatum var. saurae]|uniref:Helitron helicase-like domain-containing protein n=1 Tax=Paspalum notatum var. saurae TaxID=547442 RepID=A0AAQ3SGF3_PASNO